MDMPGAPNALAAPYLHHCFAVRFLLKTDTHHVDLALKTELGACKRKRAAPMACAYFRCDAFYIRLMAAGRAASLILIIDACGVLRTFSRTVALIKGLGRQML